MHTRKLDLEATKDYIKQRDDKVTQQEQVIRSKLEELKQK